MGFDPEVRVCMAPVISRQVCDLDAARTQQLCPVQFFLDCLHLKLPHLHCAPTSRANLKDLQGFTPNETKMFVRGTCHTMDTGSWV